MSTTTSSLFLTPDEAHELVGKHVISRRSFYNALTRKEIPSTRIGRKILIPREAFTEWLEQAQVTQPQQIMTVKRLSKVGEEYFRQLKTSEFIYSNGPEEENLAVLVPWAKYIDSLPDDDEYLTSERSDDWPHKHPDRIVD